MENAGRILLMPKGDYSASTTYAMLDIVNHSGASWVCKQACTGQTPSDSNTAYWQRLGIAVNLANYLPLAGGKLNGTAYIGYTLGMTGGSAVGSKFYNADGTSAGGIGLFGVGGVAERIYLSTHPTADYDSVNGLAIYSDNITWKNKDLLHTGNKPTGTYTGNGSATERRINVGGIGGVCVITGGGNTAYVSVYGAIILSGATVAALPYEKLNYGWDAGILKVAASEYINDVGVDYTWRIL